MEIIKNIFDLNKAIKSFKNYGFVPTMGGIHKGHISLIKISQKKCKKTIVSIFVNPTQFNKKNDFNKYPRNLKQDIKVLKRLKVDYLFIPNSREIYKSKKKSIKLLSSDKVLCAKYRKGHFEGVLNVMSRLMTLIKAKHIFMGEKDFQQLYLVKKYLSKKFRVNIISCKTIRDKNKVALSTRNNLLSRNEYLKLIRIIKKLKKIKNDLMFKNQFSNIFLKRIIINLQKIYKIKIDYLEVRDERNLTHTESTARLRMFVAFWIKNVRLIDNF